MNNSIKNVNIALLVRVALLLLVVSSFTYAQTTITNVCPSTTVNLTTRITGTPPAGTVVTWHTGTPATDVNKVPIPTSVGAGDYYAAYYNTVAMCYGNTTGKVTVIINSCATINNICPATTVNLTTRVTGTPPVGTFVVTWHTGTPATDANKIADPTSVGNGIYYAAYYDPATMCYGNTTSGLPVLIVPCPAALPDMGSILAGVTGTAINSVVANDLMGGLPVILGGGGANANISPVGTYPPGITLNTGTGAITVTAGTPSGVYVVSYQLCNLATNPSCVTTTATITVLNQKPIATDDIALTPQNTPVSGNVLTNDNDPDGGTLTVTTTPTTPPAKGTVVLNPNGTYTYTPNPGAVGQDKFCYEVKDNGNPILKDTACVTINIVPIPVGGNNKPIAVDDNVQTTQGVAVIIAVKANDVDPDGSGPNGTLGLPTPVMAPANGTVVYNNPSGTVTYTPNPGFTGQDSFTYSVCDGGTPSLCDTATVNVQVLPPAGPGNQKPVAVDDALLTTRNTPKSGDVSTNDYDPDNNTPFVFSKLTNPVNGTVVFNPGGTYTYTPNPGYVGSDAFTYSFCDGAALSKCDTATVTIAVTVPGPVVLLAKVYLQGALIGVTLPNVLMRDDLRTKGLIPTTSPYPALGLNGLTSANSSTAAVVGTTSPSGNDAIVDWVFVELRSSSSPTTVLDSRSALVQRDGDIVDVDGVSPVTFTSATPGSYYVSVRHRNHLGVMTQNAVPLSTAGTLIDFRTSSTPTYNLNPANLANQAQVVVAQGVAMWAGNANFDTRVIYQGTQSDPTTIYQQVIGASGNALPSPSYKLKSYNTADINMDGEGIFQGTNNDVEVVYANIISNHPGNAVLQQNSFIIKEQIP